MKLDVKGIHLEVTDALKAHVEKKMDKLDHKVHIMEATVVLKIINDHEQEANGKLHLKGFHIEASDTNKDMYAAIDKMVDKLARQLIKHKEKLSGE